MIHLTDAQIDTLIDYRSAMPVLEAAFVAMANGRAAVQPRVRTEAAGVKLSTLGAVVPEAGFVGAKVYTTIDGRFDFVIALFSTEDGRPLALLDAQSITRVRTAATTLLAAQALARPDASVCAILGTGVQGRAHAQALAELSGVREIRIAGQDAQAVAESLCATLPSRGDLVIRHASIDEAIDQADIVVTATRAKEPLFDGRKIKPGTFVAAIGSSLPHTRELDNALMRRAATIVVEWAEQARSEAGDLILAGDDVDWSSVRDLSAVLAGQRDAGRRRPDDIIVYKAVGIGLQDIAVAGLAYRHYVSRAARP